MTRLEHADAYMTEFEATLDEIVGDDAGTWWRLDRSAFYPTSGGQPHDTGTLEAAGERWSVAEVALRGGRVWHRVIAERDDEGVRADASATAPAGRPTVRRGAAVTGSVDWARRFRHMQRHTGQHLLSQALLRVDEAYDTRAVALASADATLDLAGEPDDAAVRAAEELVNEVAAAALPVRAFEIDERDLAHSPLRRPPKVRGRIRVVEIGTWERSACGGTHLRSTAEALPVLVHGRERVRGGLVRVTFRAGLDAIAYAAATVRQAAAAAALLSSGVSDLAERVSALQRALATERRRAAATERELADAIARSLAPAGSEGSTVVHRLTSGGGDLATAVADALAARGVTAVVATVEDGAARLVLASGAGVDVRPALRAALSLLDGRGGGRPERAQGAAPSADALSDALEAARGHLEAAAERRGRAHNSE